MEINNLSSLPLKNLISLMRKLKNENWDVWIEGKGDGTIKLMINSKVVYFK